MPDTEPVADSQAWRAAADRFDFQLGYHRSAERRTIQDGGDILTGSPLQNIYPHLPPQSGHWTVLDGPADLDGHLIDQPTVEDWLRKYIWMAISEGVHEVLEYLRVDGRHWLDPHGQHENEIQWAVDDLTAALHMLHERPSGAGAPGGGR